MPGASVYHDLSLLQAGLPSVARRAKDGGKARNRTGDTRIFSPLLYQLSYRAICEGAKLKGVPFRASMGNFVGYFLGCEQRLEIGERKFGRSSVAGLENIGE